MKPAALLILLTLGALAQTPAAKPAPSEEETIQRFRAHAAPRKVAPAAPLGPEERNIIRRFKDAKPSVVYVAAIGEFKDLKTQDETRVAGPRGTGFVWDEVGHVVTNHHVITWESDGQNLGDVREVEVTLADGKSYKGRVIGASWAYDIAVLQVFAPLSALRPIPLGRSRDLQVGQRVLAIGNPFGLDHSLSVGVVSAKDRGIDTGYNTRILNAIQTDAAVNPGNSGGPLLDTGGRLVGMNTAIIATRGEGSVGVGFAIPVDTLNEIVPKLIARERLEPPRMGFVAMGTVEAYRRFGITRGLLVIKVEPDSPSSLAGLRAQVTDKDGKVTTPGDILLGYQGRAIENEGQLLAMLEVEPPSGEIVFDVLRDGQQVKVVLDLKAKPTKL